MIPIISVLKKVSRGYLNKKGVQLISFDLFWTHCLSTHMTAKQIALFEKTNPKSMVLQMIIFDREIMHIFVIM